MKRIIKLSLVAVFACVAGYNVYQSQKDSSLSALNLANIEALAGGEWEDQEKISCMSFITSPTPDELQNGMQYPVVVDCEPCGNLVIAKTASGSTSCTYYKP